MSLHLITSERSLLLAFTAAVASFLGSTLYSQYSATAIHEAARTISGNLAPSIQHLTAARAEMRQLSYQLSAIAEGRPVPADLMSSTQQQIAAEVDAYVTLARSPNEQEHRQSLRRLIGRLDDPLLVGRVAAMLLDTIDVNAQRARTLAMRIEDIRKRSVWIALMLDGLSTLLSISVALLALRTGRRYRGLRETHHRMLEERASELDQFAGRVAHDIRGPLSAIGLIFASIERHIHEEALVRAKIVHGVASVRRMGRIIDGLLAFARAGARPEPGARAEVVAVFGDVAHELALAATAAGVNLHIEPPAPCDISCSPGILTSLISNLAHNAIKYIGDGPERRVTLRALVKPATVRITVEDTGPGLPPELHQQVFEPFVRVHQGTQPGAGLGLATVKRITEGHGGMVGVQSAIGAGSIFWFELPRHIRDQQRTSGTGCILDVGGR